MRQSKLVDHADIGSNWSDRCDYWISESASKISRRRREREQTPIFLTGHGLSLRVDKGTLLVRDGKTHYPSELREWRFFNGGLDIPPAIVVVDGLARFTMDAIDWLATQGVALIRLRWDGEFASVVSNGGQAASMAKIRWQDETRLNPKKRLAFAVNLIREKAHYTVATMGDLFLVGWLGEAFDNSTAKPVYDVNLHRPFNGF
ncbi:MAG: CRISPR-associated endonuclease Cas1 [Woeseiaceae bacterium]|nr:CRISPR-associated endonuclease Cas1 [Woeseiaceae bacterium]